MFQNDDAMYYYSDELLTETVMTVTDYS